jgi:chaperonin GroEL
MQEDRLKDAVCTLIKKSVNSTNRFAGDGTTTSTILIGELVREGRKMIESGASFKEIKEGLIIARDIGIDFIRMAAQPIATVI